MLTRGTRTLDEGDAHEKLKGKGFLLPNPPKHPEDTGSSLAFAMLQPCQAKPWLGEPCVWRQPLHSGCISNHSPPQRETSPTDADSGLCLSFPICKMELIILLSFMKSIRISWGRTMLLHQVVAWDIGQRSIISRRLHIRSAWHDL